MAPRPEEAGTPAWGGGWVVVPRSVGPVLWPTAMASQVGVGAASRQFHLCCSARVGGPSPHSQQQPGNGRPCPLPSQTPAQGSHSHVSLIPLFS